MGGGGGGNEFSEQQAASEARKQAARDALNLQFGFAPTGGTAPTREQFTTTRPVSASTPSMDGGAYGGGKPYESTDMGIPNGGRSGGLESLFDQSGYDAAMGAFNGRSGAADSNKAAREALYGKVRADAFNGGKRRLDESKTAAGRDLRFELFAKGLNGGSVDVDQNALLGRTYDQGILDLGAKADAVKNDLRGSDESTRLGLLQSIDAGMDQGSALSSAIQQMQVNNDRAASSAVGTSIGDLFNTAGLVYSDSQARKGRQMGVDNFAKLFSTMPRGGGSTGASGTISSTGG